MSRTSTVSSSRPSRAAPAEHLGQVGIPRGRQEIAAALRSVGVRPSKRWGQSFLCDPFVADAEVALAAVGPGEAVVEIGGGLGILTEALVRRSTSPITVIERDTRLARFLRNEFGSRVQVVEQDALTADLSPRTVVLGNLPFSLATPLILRLWEEGVERFVVLVQREVADRIASGPGSKTYGRLSVLGRAYGTAEAFQVVPRTSFEPVPQVEGRVLRFLRRPTSLPPETIAGLKVVLRVLFSSRRKQLGNLLPRLVGSKRSAGEAAAESEWPEDWIHRRPEELTPEAFLQLTGTLERRRRAQDSA